MTNTQPTDEPAETPGRPQVNVPDQPLAEAVRNACIAAAREAYVDAGLRGLCHEGRWEAALSAISAVDLAALQSSLEAESRTR